MSRICACPRLALEAPDRLRLRYHRPGAPRCIRPGSTPTQERSQDGRGALRRQCADEIRLLCVLSCLPSREQRNPTLLFLFVALFLFRFAARRLSGLSLFHEPPRNTRIGSGSSPILFEDIAGEHLSS